MRSLVEGVGDGEAVGGVEEIVVEVFEIGGGDLVVVRIVSMNGLFGHPGPASAGREQPPVVAHTAAELQARQRAGDFGVGEAAGVDQRVGMPAAAAGHGGEERVLGRVEGGCVNGSCVNGSCVELGCVELGRVELGVV
jgi:hypothetical protein